MSRGSGAFSTFVGKEVREFTSGWRVWVLAGLLAMFALSGPPLALYAREILQSALGAQAEGLLIADPTYVDSYQQWTKNLGDLVVFAIILLLAGIVSGECRQQTAVLVLTKPLRRREFVLAKVLTQAAILTVAVVAGSALTWAITRMLFAAAPVEPLAAAVGAWLVLGVFYVGVMVLASSAVPSSGGAAGIGIGVYVVVMVGGLWEPLRRFTPAGLRELPAALAAGQPVEVFWPVVVTLVATGVLVVGAVALFARREL